MTTSHSTVFLSQLHDNMNRSFSLGEIRTLCFDLGIDYDSIPGEAKGAKTRELISGIAREGLLPNLLSLVGEERPHVSWPPIPADFKLPSSGLWVAAPAQTIIQRDVVQGDKIGDDKTTVGNITDSSGIAIGTGAQVTIKEGDTINMSGDLRGAILNIKSTLGNVQQTIGSASTLDDADKQELKNLVKRLEEELSIVPETHDEEAEAVATSAKMLVNMIAEEKPNKTMLKISGDTLKQAAKNLAEITPDILTIATSIVMTIGKIASLG